MKIPVLDHGYVEFIEAWGTGKDGKIKPEISTEGYLTGFDQDPDFEAGIIEAARQSTQGSFRGWEKDEKLLAYLFNNNHATPFEFAGLVIEVQAPIFVFREWQRHRTQSYNEMSARYEALPDLYYTPSSLRITSLQGDSKQSQGVTKQAVHKSTADLFTVALSDLYLRAETLYQEALKEGIPKELARLCMPVGHYSRMRASASLRNWLAFLTLRLAPNAQWEIRQFASAVGQIIAEQFPRTWSLFNQSIQQ